MKQREVKHLPRYRPVGGLLITASVLTCGPSCSCDPSCVSPQNLFFIIRSFSKSEFHNPDGEGWSSKRAPNRIAREPSTTSNKKYLARKRPGPGHRGNPAVPLRLLDIKGTFSSGMKSRSMLLSIAFALWCPGAILVESWGRD